MTDPQPQTAGAGERRRLWRLLPLGVGAVLLPLCWAVVLIVTGQEGGICLGGVGLGSLSAQLARDLGLADVPQGPALAVCIYAAVSYVPFALLWACLELAARARNVRFLATLSCVGTLAIAAYVVGGNVIAEADLSRGGMLCSLALDLVPIAGVIVGGGAVVFGALLAWLVERLWRPKARPAALR